MIPRARGEQYTKNDSDFYVAGAAEEGLDDGNPFQQNKTADEPIPDPDDAAVAAIVSRDGNSKTNGKDNNGAQDADQDQHLHQPRTTNIFLQQGEPAAPSKREPEQSTNLDLANPLQQRRQSTSKHSRGLVGDAIGDAGEEEADPEVRRLVKRARRDSRALLIQPEDDADEQDRKMRANLDLRDPLVEDDDDGANDEDDDKEKEKENRDDADNQPGRAVDEDVDRPTEVAPMPLIDKISEQKDHEPVPRDAGDEDDDVETKRGDDYDVENYGEFEDDDDDMEGPDRDRFREGDLVIQEDELR